MGLQRQFERRAVFAAGEQWPSRIDRVNNSHPVGVFLHPRKGYRIRSIKNGKAAVITQHIKANRMPLPIIMWQKIRDWLKDEGPN